MSEKEIEKLLKQSLDKAFEDLNSSITHSISTIEDPRIKAFILLLLDSYHLSQIPNEELSLPSHSIQNELDEIITIQNDLITNLSILLDKKKEEGS